jgi:glycosyltransferase involved in cell wall biosynthesis
MLVRLPSDSNISELIVSLPSGEHFKEYSEGFKHIHFFNGKTGRQLKENLKNFLPDVIFIPTSRYLRFGATPVVNMVRNMEPLVRIPGNPITEIFINHMRKHITKRSVFKANRVIATSEHVKNHLDDWGIESERIVKIYHGVNVKKNSVPLKPKTIPDGWFGEFLFTAGSIRPARGLEDLLNAMKYLELEVSKVVNLVIAGESGQNMANYKKRLVDWIESNHLSSKILWVGDLHDEEMSWCYQNCSAFVMTSRVEACPNIALESMSEGCICLSTNTPPMPEIYGDTAIYYPATDGKALAKCVKNVFAMDIKQRETISKRARARAHTFSWDTSVQRTINVLAKTAGK